MQSIRNADGKLVCRVDREKLSVEIVRRGCRTTVVFRPGRSPAVTNDRVK